MAKRNGVKTANPSEIEADARRLEAAALSKKKALASLADVQATERELNDEQEPEIQEPELPPAELRARSKIEQVLEEINGDGGFTVYFLPRNGEESQIGKYDINDWPERMETIAREKGGGTFKVVFRSGEGHFVGQVTRTFDASAYGNGRTESGDSLKFLEIMQSREDNHRKEIEGLRLENQRMMLDFQKMMLEMVKSQNNSPLKTADEILAVGKLFKDDRPQSPMDGMKQFVEMLAMFREVSREPSIESDPWSLIIDKASRILSPILEAGVKKLAMPPLPRPATSPALAAPTATQAALPAPALLNEGGARPAVTPGPRDSRVEVVGVSPAGNPPASQDSPVMKQMATYAASLKTAILQGNKPEAVAAFVINSIEDAELEGFKKMVEDPGIVGALLAADASLVEHQGWLAEFFNILKEGLNEDGDDQVPAPMLPPEVSQSAPTA